MNGHTLEVSELVGTRRNVISKDGGEVGAGVLNLHVCGTRGAHVAAGAGERHPGRGSVDAMRMIRVGGAAEQVIGPIPAEVRPVREGGLETGGASGVIFLVTVGSCGDAVAVGVDAGEHGDDVVRGVRNQRRVMVGKEY